MSDQSKPIVALLLAVSLYCSFASTPTPRALASEMQVSPNGKALENMLDSMRVEELWLAGHHVNWKTGLPDGRPVSKKGVHSHCSAFVAAVADRLGIYILRPPEHSQIHLANAQVDWLREQGSSQGWREVESGEEAQKLANKGFFVIAAYKTRNPDKPGHIVVVRPNARSKEVFLEEGPQIAQASTYNFSSTSLRKGFRHHPGAFDRNRIVFFAHAIPPERVERFR
jgi:hypothetical protein